MEIVLEGQPLSTQNCYRSTTANGYNRTYMKKECVELKESYSMQARTQWPGPPSSRDIMLTVALFHGSRHRRDIDNTNKIIFDSLTGIVWDDDVQIVDLHISKHYDKARPRVELTIKEL